VVLGVNPVFGLLLFTSVGGVGMAVLGPRAANRDVEIGTVLAFMLGLGVLFVSLYNGNSTDVYSILFGEMEGISWGTVLMT
jgi:zinc/manganese transport system permease protein